MEEAVDRYLSLQPKVFPIKREASFVLLKVQKSYRSNGELLTISIQDNSFHIVSRCVAQPYQKICWGKNRDNVLNLSDCIKKTIQERSQDVASLVWEY